LTLSCDARAMEAENRAGSKDLKEVGDRVPRRSSRWSGSGSLHCPRRPGAGLACQVSRCLVLSLSLPHQCGYHAKSALSRSFPFPALLLLALHPEDRDLSREVDGHDNLWMMMMMIMMMMYGTPASSRIGSQHPRWIMYPGKVYALRMPQDNGLSSSLTVV